MATWQQPIESQTDPDAPLTSELGKRWDNNVIAFIEQDNTSPVNESAYHPYNKVTVGDSMDGSIYDSAADGVLTTITSPDLDAQFRYLIELRNLGGIDGPQGVGISFFDSSDNLIDEVLPGEDVGAGNFANLTHMFVAGDYWRGVTRAGVLTPVSVEYFTITGTNFNAGNVYLRRRKEIL